MASYHRLTLEERYQIKALLDSGLSIRKISLQLGRSPSTISRELRRNYKRGYLPKRATSLAQKRRVGIGPPRKIDVKVGKKITEGLSEQWSPEQISATLQGTKVSHETIYQFVYQDHKRGGDLFKNLRRQRRRRVPRKESRQRKLAKKLNNRWIDERPEIVEQRIRVGDFERDTVLGKGSGPVLLTIVDRTSRLTKIAKLAQKKAADAHYETVRLLKDLNIKTITNDNGVEFAFSTLTEKALGTTIYFNRPYRSWERGTNENTNGLIRQYFPKGTDFSYVSDEEIKLVEDKLNSRPRKVLGFKTPNHVHRKLNQGVALRP